MISRFRSDLRREFSGYNLGTLRKDILGGLTVAAVALPLALAFGVSSGADAASGLVTAIFASLIMGALGGASYQISGPTGTMAAILLPVSAKFGIQGVLITGFLSGVVLLIVALVKAGRIVSIIPSPVLTGFTAGISVLIASSQIDNFFGTVSEGDTLIQSIGSYAHLGFSPQWQPILFGSMVIALMILWPKKWEAIIPSSLAAIIIALIMNLLFPLQVGEVGTIPKKLILEDHFTLSLLSLDSIKLFIVPAIGVAAIGMVESLLAGAAGEKMKKEKMDPDRWLLAQGIGNLVMPFLGGVPATAAIARTSIAIKAGMKTRVTSFVHAIVLILSMFLLAPFMSRIPLSALAGVLMVTSWRMNDWPSVKTYFRKRYYSSIGKYFVTLITTVVLGLTTAILVGIGFSVIMFVISSSDIDITITNIDDRHEKGKNLTGRLSKVRLIYITGQIFFGSINTIVTTFKAIEDVSTMIVSIRGVPSIDHGSMLALEELYDELKKEGVTLLFCGLQPQVRSQFEKAGFHTHVGKEHIFENAVEAIDSL
ncbi:MAG: SulP family inorganic anion transporter [Sphaerochaetaceae bacterium]